MLLLLFVSILGDGGIACSMVADSARQMTEPTHKGENMAEGGHHTDPLFEDAISEDDDFTWIGQKAWPHNNIRTMTSSWSQHLV